MTALVAAVRWCSSLFHPHVRRAFLPLSILPFGFKILVDPQALDRLMSRGKVRRRLADLQLIYGPIDNILGWFEPLRHVLKVDVLETVLRTAKSMDPADVDRAVTKVLAHEARHVWQHATYGWLMLADRVAIFLGSYIGLLWFSFNPSMHGLELIVGHLHLGAVGVVLLLLVRIVGYAMLLTVSSGLAYQFCWAERDARAFATRVIDDPAWADVVKVELGLVVPPFPGFPGTIR